MEHMSLLTFALAVLLVILITKGLIYAAPDTFGKLF